ncbi:MAG: hypothetical protein ACK2UW_17910 [Anaerolineales bacterium]|jgi:hypothetical protein
MRNFAPCSCCSCGCFFFVLPVVLIVALVAGLVVFIISLFTGNPIITIDPYSWHALRELVLTAGTALALL